MIFLFEKYFIEYNTKIFFINFILYSNKNGSNINFSNIIFLKNFILTIFLSLNVILIII